MQPDYFMIVLLFVLPAAASLGAIPIRSATQLVMKFTPTYEAAFTVAYFSYAIWYAVVLAVIALFGDGSGSVSLFIWMILGFVFFGVNVALCARLRRHPAADPIGLGRACLVGLMNVLLVASLIVACFGVLEFAYIYFFLVYD